MLLDEIDQARYVNKTKLIDRLGFTLPISKLSTGCKASLVAAYNPTKVAGPIECGHNARDVVIRNIRDGNVLFYYNDISTDYPGFNDFAVDVLTDGRRFMSLDSLNLHLSQGM